MKMKLLVNISGFCLEDGRRSVELNKGDIVTIKHAGSKTISVKKDDIGYTLNINHLLLMERVDIPNFLHYPLNENDENIWTK